MLFSEEHYGLTICLLYTSSKRAEFAQIANRTKQKKIYTQEEIKRDDIVKLFPILEAEQKEKEIELLWRVAQTPQALRGAINLFSNAYDLSLIHIYVLVFLRIPALFCTTGPFFQL